MSPRGLSHGIVDSFIKTSPEVLFLAFGRRSILSSATMWQAILYPPIFVRVIDLSLKFLFGWHAHNITAHQKLAAYPHLYSFTSTKSVVHWFQIMRNEAFQMYDDEVQAPLSLTKGGKYYKVAKFPTRNIKTPIVLVYGGSDSLVDIDVMLKELPKHTVATEVRHYEHLDFLWASDVDTCVFPHVLDALDSYAGSFPPKDLPASREPASLPSTAAQPQTWPDDDRAKPDSAVTLRFDPNDSTAAPPTTDPGPTSPTHPNAENIRGADRLPRTRIPSSPVHPASPSASAPSHATEQTTTATTASSSTSRPEGWWSSDDVGGTESSTPSKSPTRESVVSRGSAEAAAGPSASFGSRGITLGAARAAGGVLSPGDAVAAQPARLDAGEVRGKKRGKRKGLGG